MSKNFNGQNLLHWLKKPSKMVNDILKVLTVHRNLVTDMGTQLHFEGLQPPGSANPGCLDIQKLQVIFSSQIVLDISLSKHVFCKCWI